MTRLSLVSPGGLVAWGAFTALLVAASVYDITTRRIPNQLVIGIAVLGIVSSCISASTGAYASMTAALLATLSGIALGFTLWFPFYALGWLGAGDVKLFAASAAWLGPQLTVQAAMISALVGGVLALFWMTRTYRGGVAIPTPPHISVRKTRRTGIPYGVALAVGLLITAWMHSPNVLEVFHAIR